MWKIAVIGSVVAIFFGNPAFRHCLPVFSDHDAACAVSEELGYQLSISNLDNLDELADCIDQMKSFGSPGSHLVVMGHRRRFARLIRLKFPQTIFRCQFQFLN